MKEERILDVLGMVDEKYIKEADPEVKAKRKTPAWTKWTAVAVCLCLAVFAISKAPLIKETGSPGPGTNNNDMCQVIKFDVPQDYAVSPLYYLSKPIDESIKEYIAGNNINVNLENAISVSYLLPEENEVNYWFPVVNNGRINRFVYIGKTKDGTIGWGYSESDTDIIEALSVYTSVDNPMSIVVYGDFAYYVIGDNAYINSTLYSKLTEIPKPIYIESEVQQHILDLY
ncbi:MAG: hypothetical protein HUJ67_01105 [Ruminiclostridium sp.]|nr:hypothetical protein [Ruminiclostridium sp.]